MTRRLYPKNGVQPPLGGHFETDDSTREGEVRMEADGSFSQQVTEAPGGGVSAEMRTATIVAALQEQHDRLSETIDALQAMMRDGRIVSKQPGEYSAELAISGVAVARPCYLKRVLVYNCTVAGNITIRDGGNPRMTGVPVAVGAVFEIPVGADHKVNVDLQFAGGLVAVAVAIVDS